MHGGDTYAAKMSQLSNRGWLSMLQGAIVQRIENQGSVSKVERNAGHQILLLPNILDEHPEIWEKALTWPSGDFPTA